MILRQKNEKISNKIKKLSDSIDEKANIVFTDFIRENSHQEDKK